MDMLKLIVWRIIKGIGVVTLASVLFSIFFLIIIGPGWLTDTYNNWNWMWLYTPHILWMFYSLSPSDKHTTYPR